MHHLLITNTNLSIKLKTFTCSSFCYIMGFISKKVNSNFEIFRYELLSISILWKLTTWYIYTNWFIKMLEIKFFYLVFLFLNLIGLLFEYDRYDFFYLFLLMVLLCFCYLIEIFIHDFSFWYIKALPFINFKLSSLMSHINSMSIKLEVIKPIKPV